MNNEIANFYTIIKFKDLIYEYIMFFVSLKYM